MSFRLWYARDVGNAAVLLSLEGFDDAWKLDEGLTVAADWPAEAAFRMDPDQPERVGLPDVLGNRNDQPLVSERVAAFLRERAPRGLELLPVAVLDHRGREVPERYWLVHATAVVPCLDAATSEPEYNPMDPTRVMTLARLALDEAAIPADLELLRVASVPGPVLVREGLARELDDRGFTSILWKDPANYRG